MNYMKVPPHSTEAEMAVLGAMLIDKDSISMASEILQAKDFYSETNRRIFDSIGELHDKNKPVDIVTLIEELKKQNKLEDLGGEKYLADLMEKVSTPAHTHNYAKIVKEKALLRELINVSSSVIEKSFSNQEQVEDILDYAQDQMIQVAHKSTDHGFSSAEEVSRDVLERIEKAYGNQEAAMGVPTGFKRYDEMTGGFQQSELSILAARPSQGKTAMALNIAYHAAIKSKKKTVIAIFSLEMDKNAVFERMVCSSAMADIAAVRRGSFSREVFPSLTRAISEMGSSSIWIDDASNLDILDIRNRTRKLASQLKNKGQELGLVIIDYLQLIRGSGRRESRQQEVSEISRLLKDLAKSLKIPVLALSQLNRRSEDKGREGGRPQLSDLRESGALEQDADVVALIWREHFYSDDPALAAQAKLIIAKQRNGPVGTVDLNFIKKSTKFVNPSLPGMEPLEEELAL
ncbi:MAG: replicative DNA helicase [Elusimicrobia bacterium]|nr:replicative DNA helicase [Elusimicrobiota bacterium]